MQPGEENCLTLMKASNVGSLSSCYFIFVVYLGLVPRAESPELVLAGVYVVLCTPHGWPLAHLGMETMPLSVVL